MTSRSVRQKVKQDLLKAKEFAKMNQEKVKKKNVPKSVSISAKISSDKKSEILSFLRKNYDKEKFGKFPRKPIHALGGSKHSTVDDYEELTFKKTSNRNLKEEVKKPFNFFQRTKIVKFSI